MNADFYCKSIAYDASIKSIKKRILEYRDSENRGIVTGLKMARAILDTEYKIAKRPLN